MVLFFAAISSGFRYSSDIKIDQPIWVDALIKFASANKTHTYKIPLGNLGIKNRDGKLVEKVNDSNLNSPPQVTTSLDTNSVKKDTLSKNLNDTLAVKQKVDSMAIDSTARLKYLGPRPSILPYVTFKPPQVSPLFLMPSPEYQTREVELDSTGKNVNIIDKVAGEKSKIVLTMPLEEYINMKMALEEQQDWEDLGHQYVLQNGDQGLQQVIKDITNFEIPLPSVGLLTIFGKPRISLKIAGAVDIHGAWQSQTTEGVTASLLGNTRNEPDFSQQVQINVDGTIGDKLNISADWNTQRQFDYQNQLKIKYTGYEDEIIQSVEAGNVSLQTSPLVGGSEALFGVKAKLQLGPLDLTALASQQKGQTKTITVSGGSESQPINLRAYSYATNNYFLDTIYASTSPSLNLFENYYNSSGTNVNPRYRVVQLEVWKSYNTVGGDKSKIRYANAYINLPPHYPSQTYNDIPGGSNYRKSLQPVPGQSETGRFILLQPDVDYTLHPETGYITLNTQLNDNDIIAVAYRMQGTSASDSNTCYGEFLSAANKLQAKTGDSTIVLKLVKPSNLLPQYKEAWSLQLKNIYNVGGLGINQNGFTLDIKYEEPGQDPVSGFGNVKFLHAFGFDNANANGSPQPDGQFDWNPGYTIMPAAGEIIFPTLQPFGKDLPSGIPDSLSFPDVYDTLTTFAQQNTNKDKWEITGQFSGSVTSTYNLGFNLVENSVHVYLNGAELQPNVDYTIDYNVGQLTILNNAALVPGANLKITYEQNDLFSLASKTLLGARAVLNLSDKTKLGFSLLNLNEQTLNDKVRIGEEPLSNTMMGTDFSTSGDLPFLTRALDHLISTKQMSTFTLGGEFAYMNPNPNTKTSTIASDNGQSIAYVDDFEGSKEIIPVGVSYTSWKDLSAPGDLKNIINPSSIPADSTVPQEMMKYKAHSFWFNITPSQVSVQNIWGNAKQVAQQDQSEPVLDYCFVPDTPGCYNGNPRLKDVKKNWGGMMKALSSAATNLIEQNINYIEFWMKIDRGSTGDGFYAPPDTAHLYIDLGRISEDVIPNGKLDTEDKNNNQIVDQGEDNGLDGRTDEQEAAYYHLPPGTPDPAHDNFAFNGGAGSKTLWDYFSINGTQGNASNYDNGRIPDTEDLNNNGSLDVINSYFRYAVPLDTSAKNNPFIAGRGGKGSDGQWRLIRIPLKDTSLTVGDPSLATVQYIRLFVYGLSKPLHLSFAEFNLAGNQWQSATPQDSTMQVSVINIEDNSTTYYLPPGLQRAHDNTQPNQTVLLNEQSMNLIFNGLKKGESREAFKTLYSSIDVFNYKQMKLFIHGDLNPTKGNLSFSNPSAGEYSAYVYFKFGTDSTNYYEYQEPLVPDWQEISITFSDLTRLKEIRGDSVSGVITSQVPGEPDHYYKIRGQPTLTAIKYLVVGVYNINNNSFNPGPLSGQMWVDELRVIGADNTPGWAYTASSSLQLADLMGINFNISQTSPQFHSLSQQFGNRVMSKNWGFSTNLNILKLLPFKLDDSNFKVNYSHSESIGQPQYMPGTDIQVNAAAALAEQRATDSTSGTQLTAAQIRNQVETVTTSDVLSTSGVQLKIPSSYWLVRDTWNRLSFSFNYNKSFSRSPTVLSNKGWNWNFSMNYGLNLSPDNYIYPVKLPLIGSILGLFSDYRNLKVYFTPQNFSFNMSANRYRTINVTRAIGNTAQQSDTSRDFSAQRGFSYNWKLTEGGLLNLSTDYNVHINSSLLYLETNADGLQRSSSAIFNDIFSGTFFGKDYQYTQNFDLKASPILPSLWNLDRFFSLNASYSATYQWQDNLRQQDLGVSAGYQNRTNLSMVLRLKALTDPIFSNLSQRENEEASNVENTRRAEEEAERARAIGKENNANKQNEVKNEVAKTSSVDTSSNNEITKNKHPLKNLLLFLESAVQYTLFDYDNINVNFTNSNSLSQGGLEYDNTGFNNFWGLKLNYSKGPSRAFMLGLSDYAGPRAPNAQLTDIYSQTNDLSLSTSRNLWEGATININWDVNWSYNKNTTLASDANGNTSISTVSSSGTISRTFLTFPPFLFFSFLKSGVDRVHQLDPNAQDLSDAFVQGFETFPILSKLGPFSQLANYIPRPNWTFTWSGLQSIPFFHGFAKDVSLTHSYSSTYTEGWMTTIDGSREVQSQRIQYGFNPLIGLSITFKELWGGNLIGSAKYSTTTSYDLGLSTNNITQTYSKSIGITAGYSKSGFDLPIFGISLKNDIQFSLTYSLDQNSSVLFDMLNFNENGVPQDGTVRTTIEPSIKYTISSKVTLSIFYTRTSVQPEGASTIPPTVTNEAGLDVHISIQ